MKRFILTLTTLLAVSLGSMAQEMLITRLSQLSSPFTDSQEGSLKNLIDGDLKTFWHSDWHHGRMQPHSHYLQVELIEPVKGDVTATIGRRQGTLNNHPVLISVEASSDGTNYVNVGQMQFPYERQSVHFGIDPLPSATFHLDKKAKYLRFYCDKTNGNLQEGFWHMSEFRLTLDTSKERAQRAASVFAVLFSTSSKVQVFSRQNLLDDHPYNFNTGSSSERGHDRLDSLYYLNVNTYTMPYYKEKDKEAVAQYVLRILETYDKLMESATGGFKSSSPLEFGPAEESKRLSMYYAEELEPFIVGGKGRNYVVVRQQNPNNVNYRICEGVEWWLETPGANVEMLDRVYDPKAKKKAVVKFRVFNLYGPMTEQHYERAFNELLPPLPGGTNTSYNELMPPIPGVVTSSPAQMAEGILQQIKLLADLYKDNGSTTDDAVVYSINERVTKYLSISCKTASDVLSEENRQLYRVLGKIPGYSATVRYPDNTGVAGSFEWLSNHYPQGKLYGMNWFTKGDAKCTGKSRNFLLEIYVKEK
ncbi:MAG: discoidin domain-containing protein [Bacteroidales bacterium]|nr:discoidin domain-containing protein [Bacteroidales bacterium]